MNVPRFTRCTCAVCLGLIAADALHAAHRDRLHTHIERPTFYLASSGQVLASSSSSSRGVLAIPTYGRRG